MNHTIQYITIFVRFQCAAPNSHSSGLQKAERVIIGAIITKILDTKLYQVQYVLIFADWLKSGLCGEVVGGACVAGVGQICSNYGPLCATMSGDRSKKARSPHNW